ncbi:MAG: rRNA maturation RNase YbeY [Burkholderiaceae bacterium]
MPSRAFALSLQFADPSDKALLPRHKVRRWLAAALTRPAEITVRCVDIVEARNLNHDYRGADHATNVLTFGYQEQPKVIADLVLCSPVVRREAAELDIDLQAHYAHLLVHGALHAQGLDHQEDGAALTMQACESDILKALGFRDPY